MKFNVICADPPWSFSDTLNKMKSATRRSAQSQYSTMSVADIKKIDVQSITDPMGCVLALWVPSTLLKDGIDVMETWGFKLKQTFIWVKIKKDAMKESDPNNITRIGMGRLFRQCHELVLIGTAGDSVYKMLADKSQRSVALDMNPGHSTKPDTLQDRLDVMFPGYPKVELFGRRLRKDWVVLGDGIDGLDINVAIQNTAIV